MEKKITIASLNYTDAEGQVWEKGMVMRTSISLASVLIERGSHIPVCKAKLKSFLNQQRRLTHTMKVVENWEKTGVNLQPFSFGIRGKKHGKTYISLPRYTIGQHLASKSQPQTIKGDIGTQILVVDFNLQ